MTEQRMTREELRVWCLLQLGWKWGVFEEGSECLLCTPKHFGTQWRGNGWTFYESPPEGVLLRRFGASDADPTTSIAEAWKLLPLIAEHGTLEMLREFEAQLAALMYLKDSGPSIATLICCTVYFAVTGNRVVVVEEANTDVRTT